MNVPARCPSPALSGTLSPRAGRRDGVRGASADMKACCTPSGAREIVREPAVAAGIVVARDLVTLPDTEFTMGNDGGRRQPG